MSLRKFFSALSFSCPPQSVALPAGTTRSLKIVFALFSLASTSALGAPNTAPLTLLTVAQREVAQREAAVAFLDGIVARHRKLKSLSGTWKRTGYDPQRGSFAWLHSNPAQVHYEANGPTTQEVFVSDGVRAHRFVTRDWGSPIDTRWALPNPSPQGEVAEISCDEITAVILSGQNPLRLTRWSSYRSTPAGARLLPAAMVRGVRCRGVEWKELIEGRDTSSTDTFSMWFDARGLVRRTRAASGAVVDFEMHPNVKLSPALFRIRTKY